ncbi:M23 family metallopeptidase [Halogeometricum sp. CBA1124]|uniref:M23 family metallopeptidase n=1 Tax=Halogeometricum sp. CBA1124 TaxID=2668071 RepID=UPI00142C2F85|nr:M23 family metallopeptidase [Halogeometricum sp. CBA1124]MUV57813.1 peptidoglycan DD-metalloendopeptidase family protein [Halogeometricum sp. CBA1124]
MPSHADAGEDAPASDPSDGSLLDRVPDPTNLALVGLLGLPSLVSRRFEFLEPLLLCFLFALWPFVTMLAPSRGESPASWVKTGDRWSSARFLLSMVPLQVNPFVQAQGVRQLLGHLAVYARYRFSLPDPESFEGSVTYRLPVEGEWTVVGGGHEKAHSHSWSILGQRYAYDLVRTDGEGRTHAGDGTDRSDYYCWEEPVVAPAAGVVVAASDGHRDAPRTRGWLDLRQRDIRGNYVVVEHAPDEYSVLAHLREGSVAVEAGDGVEAGQRIGLCGHSGNSTEPHLHFHVQDVPSFYRGMGLPVTFADVAVADGPEDEPTRVERAAIRAGHRVVQRGFAPAPADGRGSEVRPRAIRVE